MAFSRPLVAPCLIVAAAILVAALFGSDDPKPSGRAGTQSSTLRLAYFPNLTHAPALVGMAKGYWAHELGDALFETKVVNAGPEAMEALLAGAIDMAYVGPSPAINTYIKSKGTALRVVAGACNGGASLIARRGVKIAGISDLNLRRLAVPQLGGTQDVSARKFLARVGLSAREQGGTVQIVPVKNGEVLNLLRKGDVDAAWLPEPWATRCVLELGAERVVDERDLWPSRAFATTVLVVRSSFAVSHPGLVKAALRAHGHSVEDLIMKPAESRAVVSSELEKLTGKRLPDAVLEESWSRLSFVKTISKGDLDDQAEAAVVAGYLPASHFSLASILVQESTL